MNCLGRTILLMIASLMSTSAFAQATNLPGVSVNFGQGVNLVDTIEVLLLFTVLTMAPAIIILCTSFTRIVVVLSFMRRPWDAEHATESASYWICTFSFDVCDDADWKINL